MNKKKEKKEIKRISKLSCFELITYDYSKEDKNIINNFFKEFKIHCSLSRKDKKLMRKDFENVILYYLEKGLSLKDTLDIIKLEYLGGFYSRENSLWLPLDDVAKSYLEFTKKKNVAVFRVAAELNSEVNPILLQMALNFTMKRFPYFAMTLRKGFFNYYLDSIKIRFHIEEEDSIPVLPIKLSKTNEQIFRVLYYKNRISVEFYHGMTDGTGALEFLKVLLKEYLRLNLINTKESDNILNINDIPNTLEYVNGFKDLILDGDRSGLLEKPALQLSGKLSNIKPCRIIHFRMNTESLKEASNKYNNTISAYLLSCMFIACRGSIEEIEGDISITVPINLRKHFNSKTLRNFSLFNTIRMPISEATNIKDIIGNVKDKLNEFLTPKKLIDKLSSSVGITQKSVLVPMIFKGPTLKVLFEFFGDNVFTTSFSNLGNIELPSGMKEQVKCLSFVLGTAVKNRATCSVVSCNGITDFAISKLTLDPSFEERLYQLFKDDNIDFVVEGSDIHGN